MLSFKGFISFLYAYFKTGAYYVIAVSVCLSSLLVSERLLEFLCTQNDVTSHTYSPGLGHLGVAFGVRRSRSQLDWRIVSGSAVLLFHLLRNYNMGHKFKFQS